MRAVIFGADGLTFRIIRPLIERGDLPNFARIQREGVMAELNSTVPPMTPAAWTSIATGLKPAKHGVYDFWSFDVDVNATSISAKSVTHRKGGKAIWNILSDYNKRVVVMNVPITYPPEAVNGTMVSGLMTPSTASPFTFPQRFKDELYKVIPDYRIDISFDNIPLKHWYDEVMNMTEKRLRLQEHLLSEYEWDFAFLCYVGPDRIQHRLWDPIMTFSHESTRYYRLLDDALGRVLNRLTPEDVLFVVSDHGFVGAKKWFYINEYLRQQKFLVHNASAGHGPSTTMKFVRKIAQDMQILDLARKARRAYKLRFDKRTAAERKDDFHQPFFKNMNWHETHACVLTSSAFRGGYADVVISPEASAAEMEELRQALTAERDPETGNPLARDVYTTDDFGAGPFRPRENHIIPIPYAGTTFHLLLGRDNLWEARKESDGIHEPEGVFYAWGAGIQQGVKVDRLQVYDVVPTLLHSLGMQVEETFDGRIAQEVFVQAAQSETGNEESLVARKLKRLRTGAVSS